jgi:hypothetical protein
MDTLISLQKEFALNSTHNVEGKTVNVIGSAIQNLKTGTETHSVFHVRFIEEETKKEYSKYIYFK